MDRPNFLIPEVIQTSAMDCGPATLKSILAGFNINVSYGRLREACQTDVDGTSIDTLEDIAAALGLSADQIMVPLDHLLQKHASPLPAIVVTQLPNGLTHFVVVWRIHLGRWVQIMDPTIGRRWLALDRFLETVYQHRFAVPADDWLEWAASEEFLDPLQARMATLGLNRSMTERLLNENNRASSWTSIAALDAAVRFTQSLKQSGQAPTQVDRLLETLINAAIAHPGPFADNPIPAHYWSVEPIDSAGIEPFQLWLKGAVLIRINGIEKQQNLEGPKPTISMELINALNEKPDRPERELWHLLRNENLFTPWLVMLLALLSAGIVTLEAVFWRSMLDINYWLTVPLQRLIFMSGFLVLLFINLGLSWHLYDRVWTLGRTLEIRLRMAILHKLPRLNNRYLASRPISDMAERGHNLHRLRQVPLMLTLFLRVFFQLAFTLIALSLLLPTRVFLLALLNATLAIVLPLLLQPALREGDSRVRTHIGALSYFYLDALRGIVPIRTHGAERNMRREHEALLVNWGKASENLLNTVVTTETLYNAVSLGLSAALILATLNVAGLSGELLLIAYWALTIPLMGQEIARQARLYPTYRNHFLRLLEPLNSPETNNLPAGADARHPDKPPCAGDILFEKVSLRLGGQPVLHDISCRIASGEQVAVVGPSGAGKTSLVGLLLGWHRPATGRITLGQQPLDETLWPDLRQQTVWIDPAIQLWNRSFLENIQYGNGRPDPHRLAQIVTQADLVALLERLPDGWQTPLGEDGGLISGGEGQRVRLGRGMVRPDASLVILDEPFRGLDRPRRMRFLTLIRQLWPAATLICITHDLTETVDFGRVLVLENGRLVEDGRPAELMARQDSRYQALVKADETLQNTLWESSSWQKWQLENENLLIEKGQQG